MGRIMFRMLTELEVATKACLEEDESRWRGVGTELSVGSIWKGFEIKSFHLSSVFIASLHCSMCVLCIFGLMVPLWGKAVLIFPYFFREPAAKRRCSQSWGLSGFRNQDQAQRGSLYLRNFSAEMWTMIWTEHYHLAKELSAVFRK